MKHKRTLTTYGIANDGWTKWLLLDLKRYNTWNWACCDCGLTHKVQVKEEKGKIKFRMSRDEFLTNYWKRRLKIKKNYLKASKKK